MSLFGNDLGLSEFIFEELDRFKNHLSENAQNKVYKFIEDTVLFFSIAGPALTLPQVFKIYAEQSAVGLSPITWIGYFFLAIFWISYGTFIKNRPIVLTNFLWIIMHISIITGIYLYG